MKFSIYFLFLFVLTVYPVFAGECVTKSGFPAALTEEDFRSASNCLRANDKIAFAKLMESGRVVLLKPGVSVYREEIKLLKGIIRIRPEGETFSVWTNVEAVDCANNTKK